jgi:hypothetical protein
MTLRASGAFVSNPKEGPPGRAADRRVLEPHWGRMVLASVL